MQNRIGFVGAGTMAEAMIASLLSSKSRGPDTVFASDVKAGRREALSAQYGIATSASNLDLVLRHGCDLLVLAVKPQDLNAVLAEMAPHVDGRHLLLSIAAGRTLASIEQRVPGARVVRVMPNLPCTVGEGMSAFCAGSRASTEDRATAAALLGTLGPAVELPESAFDAVTALSGSGPAFFAYLLDAFVSGAAALGLDRDTAAILARQTMLGTARLLQVRNLAPDALVTAVASARGTTAAGLTVLEPSDVRRVIADTLRAAAERSRELSVEPR